MYDTDQAIMVVSTRQYPLPLDFYAADRRSQGGCPARQQPPWPGDALKTERIARRCVGDCEKTRAEAKARICFPLTAPVGMCLNLVPDDPRGIRTPVAGVKSRCPRPLDDGAGPLLQGRNSIAEPVKSGKPMVLSGRETAAFFGSPAARP
jgi:hypothetical protein